MEEKALISTDNEYVINQVNTILKENDISYIVKTEGAGGYFRIALGSGLGKMTTIYVSKEDFEKAIELVQVIDGVNSNEQDLSNTIPEELQEDEEDKDYEEKYKNKSNLLGKIFVYGLVGMMVLLWIVLLIQYFGKK